MSDPEFESEREKVSERFRDTKSQEPRQRAKTKSQDKEPRQRAKTKSQDKELRQRAKTKSQEPRQRALCGLRDDGQERLGSLRIHYISSLVYKRGKLFVSSL